MPAQEGQEAQERNETNEALKDMIKEKEDHYLRVMADFDNYRKRMEKDIESKKREGEKELVLELLEIVDNLERALGPEAGDPNSFKEGIRVIYQQLVDILKKHGAFPFKSIGGEFDPRFHEAIGSMESDEFPSGIIGEELRRGYFFKENLLRPSLVRVVKN